MRYVTYLANGSALVLLCSIRDDHSGRVRGIATANHMRSELVVEDLGKVRLIRKYDCTESREHADCGSKFTFGAIVKV
jgi:hypothetical protein